MMVADILSGITKCKNEKKMTVQQIADASGVPKSTVDRILRGETPNPSLQNIIDIADAVGYAFVVEEEAANITDPATKQIIHMYEDRIRHICANYNSMLAMQGKWIRFAVALCIILGLFIIAVLLYDVTHPDIGWIQEQLIGYTGLVQKNIFDAVLVVWVWDGRFI